MNKIEELLTWLDSYANSLNDSYGLPLSSISDTKSMKNYLYEFIEDILVDYTKDQNISETKISPIKWLDDYINPKFEPIKEVVKITYSTLKNFSWEKVMEIANIDIFNGNQVYKDDQIFEITKEQFNQLFK